ncbi:glycosyltransferase involved in cell wall biosynthesis [Arthrobacter ulcerisalmonis]|nr:glycosyltransferase involved in cell wall biosynthesis [Arthrobacter ulcerisalmonis]
MAVQAYAKNTPGIVHHLLYATRDEAPVTEESVRCYESARKLPRSVPQALLAVRKAVRELRPAVVHSHSSFAGMYVRTAISKSKVRIVHTPHCYAFERGDLRGLSRRAFRLAEQVLSINTSLLAGCSPREVSLASRMWASETPIYLPNVSPARGVSRQVLSSGATKSDFLVLVGIGRVGPQKGTGAFSELVTRLREVGINVSATWVGGGDSHLEDELRDCGVTVTGWISPDAAYDVLNGADIYFHSAGWEGFPVSVLEAISLGVPVIVRDIPAFDYIPDDLKIDSALHAAFEAGGINDRWRTRMLTKWKQVITENNDDMQAKRLRLAYGIGT